jgi:hypothetical protein
MKKIVIYFALIFVTNSFLFAQTSFKFNQYNIFYDGALQPIATLFTNQQISEKFGFNSYFYINAYEKNSWGEGLLGFSYAINKFVKIGFLGGFQTNETEIWRIAPIVFMQKNKFSFSGVFEFGGKRYRWDTMAFYHLKKFKLGVEGIKYYKMIALGPRFEYTLYSKYRINFFYSGLFDVTYGKYASMIGIYAIFGTL